MITLFDLLVVAGIVACAVWGWRVGLQAASVAALEVLACLSVAVMLHETVAGFLHAGLAAVLGDWASQAWSTLLSFAVLAWGPFALLRVKLHGGARDEDPENDIDPLGDRLAGAVAGGFGGTVLVGGVLVTLSMTPFLAWLKPSGDRMLLDVGKTALRAAGQFATERREGRSLPLWGEPPSRASVAAARLTSEPWFDADDDGAFGEADRFRDVDGNGTFTKDLYFDDVDGDGFRRVGLVDKYVAGRWDARLISNDRPRPEPKKPDTPPAKPARPPAPATPRPATPPEQGRPETAPKEPSSTDSKPADGKPAGTKPAERKPVVGTPSDGKPADGKPAVGKPTDGKPKDGKPADAPDADAPPAGGKRPEDDF